MCICHIIPIVKRSICVTLPGLSSGVWYHHKNVFNYYFLLVPSGGQYRVRGEVQGQSEVKVRMVGVRAKGVGYILRYFVTHEYTNLFWCETLDVLLVAWRVKIRGNYKVPTLALNLPVCILYVPLGVSIAEQL